MFLLIAHVGDAHGIADGRLGNRIHEVVSIVNRFPIHAGNDVARLQARFFRGAAGLNALQDDPISRAEFLQNDRIRALRFREAHANRAASHFAVGDNLVVDADGGVGGQSESHAFIAVSAGNDRGVDADHLACHIDEWPAGISGIDCRVGLNESLKLLADITAILGANDACSDAALQESKWIADSESPVTHLHGIGIAKLRVGQIVAHFNFQNRQIGLFVNPDDLGGVLCLVPIQCDLNLGGLIDDVIVRQNKTLLIDDHARAQAAFGRRAFVRKIEEAVEKVLERLLILVLAVLVIRRTHLATAIALPWRCAPFSMLLDHLRGRNIYDRRLHLFHDAGKGARQLHGIWNRQRRSTNGRSGMRGADMSGDHRAN